MHYYQFNIGDYASHTAHLDPLEDLAYRRLLDLYYLSEKPLSLEVDEVARLIRMRSHNDCIAYVLKSFFTQTSKGYINKRADKIISDFKSKSEKAKASANERWDKAKKKQSLNDDANALRPDCDSNANQETRNINQETVNSKQDKPAAKPLITFSSWIQKLKDAGEDPISADDPIFDYALDAGIDMQFLRLAWEEFRDRYVAEDKRYKDWRAVYRKAIRENWLKLWWHDVDGYKLTSKGMQAMTAMNNRDKREGGA